MSETDSTSFTADLMALAVASPRSLANLVALWAEEHPELATRLRAQLEQSAPRAIADGPCEHPLPEATPELLSAVRALRKVTDARVAVSYPVPLTLGGFVADLSVEPGDESIVIGGNVVSLIPVARLVGTLHGEISDRLDEIGDQVSAQLGGRLSRRTMSRTRRGPSVIPGAERLRFEDSSLDRATAAVQAMASLWSPAAGIRRGRSEDPRAYFDRVLAAARAADDEDAKRAITVIAEEFPELLGVSTSETTGLS